MTASSFHPPLLPPLSPALSLISIIRQDKTDQSLGLPSELDNVQAGGAGVGEVNQACCCYARPAVRSQVRSQGSNNAPQVLEIVNSPLPRLPRIVTCQAAPR